MQLIATAMSYNDGSKTKWPSLHEMLKTWKKLVGLEPQMQKLSSIKKDLLVNGFGRLGIKNKTENNNIKNEKAEFGKVVNQQINKYLLAILISKILFIILFFVNYHKKLRCVLAQSKY